MHRNPVWLIFLALFSLVVFWYAGDAVYKIYRYEQMTSKTYPSSIDLEVTDPGSSRYYYISTYTIDIDGKTYEASEQLREPIFRNKAAAEAFKDEYLNDSWTVWYAPKNPNQSTLQKSYPFKELMYALCLFGLLCYFLWLGFKVADQSKVGVWKR